MGEMGGALRDACLPLVLVLTGRSAGLRSCTEPLLLLSFNSSYPQRICTPDLIWSGRAELGRTGGICL